MAEGIWISGGTMSSTPPNESTLYEPRREHDSCGTGAVVNILGQRNHNIIELAKQVLVNLLHRGGGGDESTGDGAGILIQIPDAFFQAEARRLSFTLPVAERYAVGMVFGPKGSRLR